MPKTNAWPTERERPMLLCHFSKEELQGMDDLQGGPTFDKYGIREYSKLGKIIKIPEIRKIFTDTVGYAHETGGKLPPEIEQLYKQIHPSEPKFQASPHEDQHPQIKAIKDSGIEGDTDVAWVPEDMVEFLIELRGEPKTNPSTGLLMFGGIGNVLRVVGAVGGGIIGGILTGGALPAVMAGAGLGSFGARLATGQGGRKAFWGALGDAGKAGIVSGIGGALHSVAPSIGATLGTYLPQGVASAAGNFFTGPMSTMGMLKGLGSSMGLPGMQAATLGGPGQAAAQGASGAATAAGNVASTAGAAPGSQGFLGGLLSNPALMMPLMGALYFHGKQQEHKHNQRVYEDALARQNRDKEMYGFNKPWAPLPKITRHKNPEFWNQPQAYRERGILPEPYFEKEEAPHAGGFATGGHAYVNHDQIQSHQDGALIKGPGKGQDDRIATTVPENSYILDATTVSAFGDGSSHAGAHILKQFENQIKDRYRRYTGGAVAPKAAAQLPVYLSNDEYIIKEPDVTAIGGGDNGRGARILKQMVLELRKDKAKNGIGLAPKAKDPLHYMNKAVHNIAKGRKHAS